MRINAPSANGKKVTILTTPKTPSAGREHTFLLPYQRHPCPFLTSAAALSQPAREKMKTMAGRRSRRFSASTRSRYLRKGQRPEGRQDGRRRGREGGEGDRSDEARADGTVTPAIHQASHFVISIPASLSPCLLPRLGFPPLFLGRSLPPPLTRP